ncbi:MAG: DPP IV N-terminal domain-containing protein, partial [Phycisphaerales bacterium]
MLRALAFVIVTMWTAACSVAQAPQTLRTPAEAGVEATSAQINAFLDDLAAASERVAVIDIGTTEGDARIPVAIVAEGRIDTAAAMADADAPLVLLFAGAAGSTDGALTMARNLATAEAPGALTSLVVAVAPMPADAGNWLSLEGDAQRALGRFIREWSPAAIVALDGADARWGTPAGMDDDLGAFITETLAPGAQSAADDIATATTIFALQGRVSATAGAGQAAGLVETMAEHADALAKAVVGARERAADVEGDDLGQTYLLDAGDALVAQLQRHGLEVGVLREDVTVDVNAEARDLTPGAFLVSTEQEAGRLAVRLLDPASPDRLAEVGVIADEAYLLTRGARKPPEERETGRRITKEMLYGEDEEQEDLNFRGSPLRVRAWIDDEHYAAVKDGTLVKVEARTGRAVPFGAETDEIESRLAESAFITEDDAERIAGAFRTPDPEHPGVLFTHADDLFFANFDGTGLRRLTSTPAEEEMATFSPDGRTIAFVRENNLFVLDLETGAERAITTEGTNTRRFGKNAWVYFEEVFGRSWKAFWWSPTSEHIVFMESDESQVPVFTIIDDEPDEQVIEAIHYPKAGQTNPTVRVHIASRA